jgi:hypothetical protein
MRIIKEELQNVFNEAADDIAAAGEKKALKLNPKKAFNWLMKDPNTQEKFIKDNPEAAAYVKSGIFKPIGDAAITQKAFHALKEKPNTVDSFTIYYKSQEDKAIADGIEVMVMESPWSKKSGPSSWRTIGGFFNTFIHSTKSGQYQGEHAKGGKWESIDYSTSISHSISIERFNPKLLLLLYEKEYGKRAKMWMSWTVSKIEKILAKAGRDAILPGGKKWRQKIGKSLSQWTVDDLPNKNIPIYSYMVSSVSINYHKGQGTEKQGTEKQGADEQ